MVEKIERKFGRIPSPPDSRDFNLKNFIPISLEPLPKEKTWDYPAPESLDQKDTSHCIGFSMANFGINLPIYTPYSNEDGHEFYYMCKIIDGYPGSEEGSTLRSAAKVLRNERVIEGYAFAYDLESIKWWLLNRGPIIVGTLWTVNMFYPDENGIISIGEHEFLGGHAYLLNQWREDDYIRIQNSWGNAWGKNGSAWISAKDLSELLKMNGEAITAVELEQYKKVQDNWFIRLIKAIIVEIKNLFS